MATKKEIIYQQILKATSAGNPTLLETVNFDDVNRPKTCLEVDFPILPINEIAKPETSSGAARKPIYTASKYWARRSSAVFRALCIAAATKAPEEGSNAAKLVWDNFYHNHKKRGGYKNITVADIFMGGGTTMVEGSRLGMNMIGNDLNPLSWFIVNQSLAKVDAIQVKSLLDEVENHVKPQITPYFYCDGPFSEKGKWTHIDTNEIQGDDFNPLFLNIDERFNYKYEGPEIIYSFWGKHAPCSTTGCGHLTPIMSNPLVAIKSLTVGFYNHTCEKCGCEFDVEETEAKMAPDLDLIVSDEESKFATLQKNGVFHCPSCFDISDLSKVKKSRSTKKIELSLLSHPDWLKGQPRFDAENNLLGGSAQDDLKSSEKWLNARSSVSSLLQFRGPITEKISLPNSNTQFKTTEGTIRRSKYQCASCGTQQELVASVRASKKTAPLAVYAIHGYSKKLAATNNPYGGRFFSPITPALGNQLKAAAAEWDSRKLADLSDYWPREEIPEGVTTTVKDVLPNGHNYTNWWMMFEKRQLLVHSLLLKSISTLGNYSDETRGALLCAFQQFLRANCSFSFWNMAQDCLEPFLGNNNFGPKSTVVENTVFNSDIGRGSFRVYAERMIESIHFKENPWDLALYNRFNVSGGSGKTEKVRIGDAVGGSFQTTCGSSTELNSIKSGSVDLVITDPPFGHNIQYAELADFFYVWLRIPLKAKNEYFKASLTPKALEAVTNSSREPDSADEFYKRLLTQCWQESSRILKKSGILTFTFHHSEDEPWVAVLESLFESGFYLEATYPIRSDETKGDGQFGSQKIEYDIIHVCRKRIEEPRPVSWGRMRREVMADVRQLQSMLENHAKEGLPAADIQVIRRGKALEYFSRHYGKVYVDEGRSISVKEALVGINQLIDEDADKGKEPPPVNAEPMTRLFLRTFGSATELKRDQLQKFLKGSITSPDEFEQRGWCAEKSKVFTRVNPLEFARDWSGRHKRRLTSDLDQAMVLIGACFDGSGINASDTLKNENFKPHVALKPLLEWLHKNDPDQASRNAASRAVSIYNSWSATQGVKPTQGSLFEGYEL